MKSYQMLLALMLCTIMSHSLGVHMILNRDIPALLSTFVPCGILTCRERVSWIDGATPKKVLSSSNTSLGRISRMDILKTIGTNFGTSAGDNVNKIVLASVTFERPNMTVVKNGIKMSGALRGERATIQLELFKKTDCSSEFTCQATGTDNTGREFFSTTTLLQQPESIGMQTERSSLSPAPSLQQVLTRQLNTQLALAKTSMDKKLQSRVESLKDVSFERRMEDRLNSLENRIEDKIDQTILEKLYRIDAKLSANNKGYINIESKTPRFEQLQHEIKDEHHKEVETNLDKSSNFFSLLEENLTRNLTESMKEVIESEKIANNNTSGLGMSSANAHELLLSLKTSLQNQSAEMVSASEKMLSQLDTMLSRHLQSVVTNIFIPKSCKKGMIAFSSGAYPHILIQPRDEGGHGMPYLCDTITDGGGWILIQRRTTGHVDFYRDWATYKKGFGSLHDDFWLGNDRIHTLTSNGTWELRVDLTFKGKAAFAHYDKFFVDNELNKYKLTIGHYDGNAGDSLRYHQSEFFTTYDKDNDRQATSNCAKNNVGGWWYNACDYADLNSLWEGGDDKGLEWHGLTGRKSASSSEMKIRRLD